MAKHAIYHEEAKRLYMQEGLSLDAIVNILQKKISRKTLYNWKVQGDWDTKRKNYLKETESLQSQLMKLAQIALKEALANPTPHNIYAVIKAISALKIWQGVQVIEDETKDKQQHSINDILKAISEQTGES